MISIVLTDDTTTLTLPILEVPLTERTLENAVDVQTLDWNVYTHFVNLKRGWSHTWDHLSEDQYNSLRGFYTRQFTLYKYPTISIDYYSIADVPVRMSMNEKKIYDNCGSVEDVTLDLRETIQLPTFDYLLLDAGDRLEISTNSYLLL